MTSGPSRARTRYALAAAAIVLLGLSFRLTGIERMLPHRPEPDAFFVHSLQEYEHDPTIVRTENYLTRYPSFVPRLLSLLSYPERPARATGPGSEATHLAAASFPYVRVRTGIALASALGVFLLYRLASRIATPGTALAACFLFATSLLSILFAQQSRPHTPQATMALATVLLSLRVLEKPSAGRILLATLAGAAAAACLQNGMIALLPLATALFLGRRELGTPRSGAESRRKGSRVLVPLLVAGGCAVAAVAIALPFYPALPYLDADGFHFGPPESRAHRIPLDLGNVLRFAGIREAVRVLWAHDPMLTVLGLAGILVGSIVLVRRWRTTARSRRLEFLVIAAYVAPYTAVLLPNPFVFERFMLPLLPYLSLLGGWLVATLAGWVVSRASAPVVRTLLGVAVCAPFLLPPAWVAYRYGRVASAPDKYELATQWIRENAEPDARILTSPATVLPLLYDPAFLRLDLDDRGAYALPWLAYQAVLPDDADPWRSWKIQIFPSKAAAGPNRMDPAAVEPWLVESDPDYVVLEISRYMERLPATAALEAAVRRLGTRVYHSTGQMESIPGSGTGEYQAATRFAFWLCDAESFGPDLDIYRMHGRTHGAR